MAKKHNFNRGKSQLLCNNNFADQTAVFSNQGIKSEMTKISKNAEASPPVVMGDTSRVVNAFSLQFDRYYSELQDKIFNEYSTMRQKYMEVYQTNFELNNTVKEDRITDFNQEIAN